MRIFQALLALSICSLPAAHVAAQPSPFGVQVARIIVPYPPGSGPDVVSRHLSQELGEVWGTPPAVENKLGASGIVAINEFKRSSSDRPTLILLTNEQLVVNRSVYKSLPYDVEADFSYVGGLYQSTFVIVASQKSGISNLADLFKLAKQRSLSYASNGRGSLGHLSAEAISTASDINLTHVPIRSLGELATSVGGGDIDLVFITPPAIKSLVQTGRASIIATMSPTRQELLPNVPTLVESGGPPLFHVRGWNALVAQKSLPKATLERVQADIQKIVRSERFKAKLAAIGVDPWPARPEEVSSLAADEFATFKVIASKARIELE